MNFVSALASLVYQCSLVLFAIFDSANPVVAQCRCTASMAVMVDSYHVEASVSRSASSYLVTHSSKVNVFALVSLDMSAGSVATA